MAKLKVAPVKSEKKVLREQIEKKLQKTFSALKRQKVNYRHNNY